MQGFTNNSNGTTSSRNTSNFAIPCPPSVVRRMAAAGKSKAEIAEELGMVVTTFNHKLNQSVSVRQAYEAGLHEFKSFQSSEVAAYDEDASPALQPRDRVVLKALRSKRNAPKRIKDIREITGFTDWEINASLERLTGESLAQSEERGLYFTYYSAV